jgi:hypothetical protein
MRARFPLKDAESAGVRRKAPLNSKRIKALAAKTTLGRV